MPVPDGERQGGFGSRRTLPTGTDRLRLGPRLEAAGHVVR
jgi:hypothetical protein